MKTSEMLAVYLIVSTIIYTSNPNLVNLIMFNAVLICFVVSNLTFKSGE